jgi:hypothetical protein
MTSPIMLQLSSWLVLSPYLRAELRLPGQINETNYSGVAGALQFPPGL